MLLNKTTIALGVIIALLIGVMAYRERNPRTRIIERFTEVAVPDKVEKLPEVKVPIKAIRVIEKKAAVEYIDDQEGIIPEEVKDADVEITGIGEVPASDNDAVIVSIVNTTSGETNLLQIYRPRAFFEVLGDWLIGARYGLSSADKAAYDVHGQVDLLRTGHWYWGVYGEINQRPEAKIMAQVEYRR